MSQSQDEYLILSLPLGTINTDTLTLIRNSSITPEMLSHGKAHCEKSPIDSDIFRAVTYNYRIAIKNFYHYKDNYDHSNGDTSVDDWRMIYHMIKYDTTHDDWRVALLAKARVGDEFVYYKRGRDGVDIPVSCTEEEYIAYLNEYPYSMAMQLVYDGQLMTDNLPTHEGSAFIPKGLVDDISTVESVAIMNFGRPCKPYCPVSQLASASTSHSQSS